MMSLSSVECVDVSPTASRENVTRDILRTLTALFCTSERGHVPWLMALSWIQTLRFTTNTGIFSSALRFPSSALPSPLWPPLLWPLITVPSSPYIPNPPSLSWVSIKFIGFSSVVHNSRLIRNLVPNTAGHSWVTFEVTSEELPTNDRAPHVSGQHRAFTQTQAVLVIRSSYGSAMPGRTLNSIAHAEPLLLAEIHGSPTHISIDWLIHSIVSCIFLFKDIFVSRLLILMANGTVTHAQRLSNTRFPCQAHHSLPVPRNTRDDFCTLLGGHFQQ